MTTTRVKHPILHLDVLRADGTRMSDHRVFCRFKRRSVQVDACCSCVHCDEVTDGPAPAVHCSLPVRPLDHADDPAGERVEVGAVLCVGTVVLQASATLGTALDVLRAEDRRSVAVVDVRGALVGLVHEGGFVGRRGLPRVGLVSAAMSSPLAVHERTPVRLALKLLAANHLREVVVVSEEGVPLGVFRDVDGLRWIAGTRDDASAGAT